AAQLALDAVERQLRIGRGPMSLPHSDVKAPGRPGDQFDLVTGKKLPYKDPVTGKPGFPPPAPMPSARMADEAKKGNPVVKLYLLDIATKASQGDPVAQQVAL